MHTFRTAKTAAISLVAGGVALGVVTPASAASGPVTERYAGRAGAQVAELSLFGRSATFGSAVSDSSLEAIEHQLSATATGVGTDLAPETRSVARFGDPGASGGTSCATPRLGAVLARARSGAQNTDALTPDLQTAPACGSSRVTGTPSAFTAESNGGRTQLSVRLPDALQSLVGTVAGQMAPATLATPVGDLVKAGTAADTVSAQAVGTLNGVLGRIAPGVALPMMEPHQTVATLLQRLRNGDLLHIDLASATARNAADATTYVTEALSQGGVIDVLPGFQGQDSAPLLRITIARSRASVPVDRASATVTPVVDNPLVRIESDLLGTLPVAGPPVVAGLVHGVPLAGLPGADLPVAGGLLGGGLPLDKLVAGLGLHSGAGYLEIGPGQSLSVLCDGAVAALCSEIGVSAAKAPATLPGGVTHAEASTVTVHLFKALDSLTPGAHLGTALAQPAATRALSAPDGVSMGDVTGIPGIRLVAGGVVAEAGGTRVLAADTTAPAAGPTGQAAVDPTPAGNLPHTGGRPFSPAAAPALVGSSVALGCCSRRRRRA
jgi:hypothetical protein